MNQFGRILRKLILSIPMPYYVPVAPDLSSYQLEEAITDETALEHRWAKLCQDYDRLLPYGSQRAGAVLRRETSHLRWLQAAGYVPQELSAEQLRLIALRRLMPPVGC